MSRALAEGSVTALLGPTNTGKTHRAVERMLQHKSGMIGLPLRLLAREIYDRLTRARGESAVALITGEEKRVPADPRYWVCTVEAMPLDRPVAFLCVDEIQLAADRTRGHTFTDRVLRARGVSETWLLGSDTIAPVLERLLPEARIESHPRLSTLKATPPRKIASLPRRSAVVAFSAESVYEHADRVRAHHGGAAVVLGALSPRARNAQLAMFEAGDVDHLVATDAIGMGLNIGLDHVAFSAVRKFDGRSVRDLTAAEVGQIAGRAGRNTRDGTFGPTTDLGELDPELVAAVEGHRFDPLPFVFWRNPELDFSSIEDLRASLERDAHNPLLVRMRDAEDHRAFEALADRPGLQIRDVGLLWEVCGVPDFGKHGADHHDLLAMVYGHLTERGSVPADVVAERIDALDRPQGEIDMLLVRRAAIRTWTFLANRRGWLDDAGAWQGRAREVEDRLSDAIHNSLTARFVDRRALSVKTGSRFAAGSAVDDDGTVKLGGDVVGVLKGLRFVGEKAPIGEIVAPRIEARVAAICDAKDNAFTVEADPQGIWLTWDKERIAALSPGPSILEPRGSALRPDLLGSGQVARIQRRVDAFLADRRARIEEPITRPVADQLSERARGFLYEVITALGSLPADRVPRLSDEERAGLARCDLRFGMGAVFVVSLLRQEAIEARSALLTIATGAPVFKGAPPSVLRGSRKDADWWAIGYRPLGSRAIRVDLAERVAARLRELGRNGKPFDPPADLPSWIGCKPAEIIPIAADLGFVPQDGQLRVDRPVTRTQFRGMR